MSTLLKRPGDYTPTTDEVRIKYSLVSGVTSENADAEFGRWLEAERAKRSVVTTVEELDALPHYSVIQGGPGLWPRLVYERYPDGWLSPRRGLYVDSIHLAMILPATVLYQPEQNGDN